MAQYKINFESMDWESPAKCARFKAYEQDGKKLRLAEFSKEFIEPGCTKGHIGYILEGQIEIEFDGKAIVFGPGDGLFIPAGPEHNHKAKVLTDKVKAILMEDA